MQTEGAHLMTCRIGIGQDDMLVVVDVQNDFCAAGALAVPGADEIVPLVNRIAREFRHAVLTQDWHPSGHISFASSHPGRKPFETIRLGNISQVLWPDHCVQGTRGAEFHPALDIPHAELILRKGFRPDIDSYSAFYENGHAAPTGLSGYLRERGFRRVFLAGLAFDFCVRYSAEDARRCGFPVYVFADASRAIDADGSIEDTHASFARANVTCVTTADIIRA